MHAGRPIAWAIIRSETTAVYERLLRSFKQAVEQYAQQEAEKGRAVSTTHNPVVTPRSGKEYIRQPSCVLVDNSDAEISAIR